jgi:hypothetical protein
LLLLLPLLLLLLLMFALLLSPTPSSQRPSCCCPSTRTALACFAAGIACCRSCSSLSVAALLFSALRMRARSFGAVIHAVPLYTCHVSVTWSGVRAELATLIHPASFPASMLALTLINHSLLLA